TRENDMARTLTDEEKREYDRLTKGAKQIQMNIDDLMNNPTTNAKASIKGYVMSGSSLELQNNDSKTVGTN
ncbi:MAG: hypothetical protein K6E91_05455, partial [Butyrivibrio sp.]|nr:hypothetical protein [Butyrivibrio sp.]